MGRQGLNVQGLNVQGLNVQGLNVQGLNVQGLNVQGLNVQGLNVQGLNVQGLNVQGIDRLRSDTSGVLFTGLAYGGKTKPGTNLQILQPVPGPSAINIDYSVPPQPAPHLQAGPGAAETGAGSYIKVQGLNGSISELVGTIWELKLADAAGHTGGIPLYISDVSKDPAQNSSRFPANDDIYLYTVYYRHPATNQWVSLCPVDPATGMAAAMAMPQDPNDAWTTSNFTFACTATGVGAKCARNWGYKPWVTTPPQTYWSGGPKTNGIPLKPFYDACLISARADYCQDGTSYTKNGTTVDLFDTLDGFTSINPTAGMPYAPNASGIMLHEEYQISALDLGGLPGTAKPQNAVQAGDSTLMSLSDADRAAILALRRSSLESARYADLDPGRSCLAAPYIDRCDPSEIYGCFRDDLIKANPYGAFIAVNSPRHCDHNETTDGAPLDPLCNQCVNRVCSIDPTCCGLSNTFYPPSLVWDKRCSDLRQKVCKTSTTDPVWKTGEVAEPAGTKKLLSLRGATGSLDGFVIQGGVPVLEGWACDPDFPGASSTIQVSVGDVIGKGSKLITARADLSATDLNVRAEIAAECGVGRHVFRVPLAATDLNATVYVYGFDLNTPAAPLSLLRGGKKTLTTTPPPVLSAIWSGWLETTSTQSGQHTFSVRSPVNSTDAYRVWVNGQYVAASNWPNPDPTSPSGAFTAPDIVPQMFLQQGVRYAVRVEYLRRSVSDGSSGFMLQWSTPTSGGTVDIPPNAFHPLNPGVGNGLLGSYYTGAAFTGLYSQNYGALDSVWTTSNLPGTGPPSNKTGLSLKTPFSARFQGQVVPPMSGSYSFTADSDGAVSITVNGKLVTSASQKPAGDFDPKVCDHDLCRTGGPLDRACDQGFMCAATVCITDPYCCSTTWDARCLQKVSTACNIDCRPTKPAEIVLRGGAKYDITVEYQHPASDFGGRLRLYWAIDGSTRDTIPVDRLYATPSPAPAPSGFGLNGAYFSDTFTTPVLDHGDLQPSFSLAAPPRVDRPVDIVCGYTGVTCPSDVIGPPAVTTPLPGQSILAPSVIFKGVGGISSSNTVVVTVSVRNPVTLAVVGTTTGKTDLMGAFTTGALTLATGKYQFSASQTASTSSAWIDFDYTAGDPALPASPGVTIPTGGIVTAAGGLTIGGTGTTGAKVTVTVTSKTVPPTTTTYGNIPVTNGAWSLALTLPSPGAYALTTTQTTSAGTSAASAAVAAKYAIPAVTVDTPTENASSSTGMITVTGKAKPGLGKVIVQDGDERYTVDRQTLDVDASTGRFGATPVPLALDAGSHVLKIFQRLYNSDGSTNLDGEPTSRHVVMQPLPAAVAALKIDCAALGTSIGNDPPLIKGSGAPARTDLRYSVNIYQGSTKIASAPVLDDKTFSVVNPHLTGVGPTTLKVTLVATSLSGGGSAESAPSPIACNTNIKPPPPAITQPQSGLTQTAAVFAMQGTGLIGVTGATVSIVVDGVTKVSGIAVSSSGAWGPTNVTVANGLHRIQATQTFGVPSDPSTAIIVGVGDTAPPEVKVNKPAGLTTTNGDATGIASFDFVTAGDVSSIDNGVKLALTCVPANSSAFPLGTSNVTCSAKDTAGNVGLKSFQVVVKSKTAPSVTGATITAEATGPNGAAVSYQVSASGFVANCGAGSTILSCPSWQLANTGLGFEPTNVAMDPRDGTLYASQQIDPTNTLSTATRMVTQNPTTGTWTQLDIPGPSVSYAKIAVAPTAGKSTVFVPTTTGLTAFSPGDVKSRVVLPGLSMRGSSVDPNNPLHVFAWSDVAVGGGPAALFETTDGGQTWTLAGDGLPLANTPGDPALYYPHITNVAFDKLHPGHLYAIMEPAQWTDPDWAVMPLRLFRKWGSTPWERLSTPPTLSYPRSHGEEDGLAIAPTAPAGQTYPTIFAGPLMSIDGGETFKVLDADAGLSLKSVVFDPLTPKTIYATNGAFLVSNDSGNSWTGVAGPGAAEYQAIFQDPILRPGQTNKLMYVSARLLNITADGGVTTAHSKVLFKGAYAASKVPPAWQWTPVEGPQVGGTLMGVQDMAFDPSDPGIAYLFARSGVYKTTTAGSSWVMASNGIVSSSDGIVPKRNKIAIDPFTRATLYLSGAVQPGPDYMISTLVSLDAAGSVGWAPKGITGLVPGQTALFAADPALRDVFFVSPAAYGDDNGAGLVYLSTPGVSAGTYLLAMDPLAIPHAIEVLPDAARTVVVSYHRYNDTVSPTIVEGGIALFSARDTLLPTTLSTPSPVRATPTGRPSRGPVFDNSNGQNNLYVSGDAIGKSAANMLYKASLDDPNLPWSLVGGGQPGIDFRRLVVDRNGGGQVMYTVGTDDSFWQSNDGGLTWAEDTKAPALLNRVWSSPLDGTLFAAVNDTPTTTADLEDTFFDEGPLRVATIWKRSPDTSLPVGARIVLGPLHVTCRGPDANRASSPGSIFPITPAGTPTVLTCTAKDVFGNVGTGTISIAVSDTLPPVFTVTPPTVQSPTEPVLVKLSARAHDAVDGDVAMTCTAPGITGTFTPTAGASFKFGITTVTCTAKDHLNHAATTSFPVTVIKTNTTITAPTLTVPGPTTIDATTRTTCTSAFPSVKAAKSTGTALTPTCTPLLSSAFALGTTSTVSCTVTDSGFTVTKTFDVTCADRSPPVITVPSPGPTVSATATWGAVVTFTATKKDLVDDAAAVPASCSPATGSVFPIGTTAVVCSAVDKAGNSATKSFNVTVKDVNAPKLTVPALLEVEPQDNLGARVTYAGLSATDVEDGPIPAANILCAPSSGSWFPLGETTVNCQATDSAGNIGRASFTVRVIDKTAPTVTVPATMAVEATTAAGAPVTFIATAFDTVSGVLIPKCTRHVTAGLDVAVASGNAFPLGESVVTCAATDTAGNVGKASFLVIVRDTSGPQLLLPGTTTGKADDSGTALVTFSATASDRGVPVPVVCTPASGSRFQLGTTPVACVARDALGNGSRGTFNVVVTDQTAPVISGVPGTTVAYATTTAGAAVTYTNPTAKDAIDGVRPVTCAPASGSTFKVNKTTVTCTATDVPGNKATKTFTVWVQYQTKPATGGVFLPPLLSNGSAMIQRSLGSLDVAFPLTGPSAPITNLTTASLTIAPVVGGAVGTFVNAIPASGTGNLFTYDSVGKRYVFKMSLNLADGIFRLHAELGDGITREVDFSTVMSFAPLTLAAGWTGGVFSTNQPASALADGIVYLRGAMAWDGTVGSAAFVLPVGQRPSALVFLPVNLCNSAKGHIEIDPSGAASLFASGSTAAPLQCFASLDGLSFVVNNAGHQALPLQPGWNASAGEVRGPTATISSDVVHLAGAFWTTGTSSVAATLPANMRPAANVYVPISLCFGGKGRLLIAATGTVTVVAESGSFAGCDDSLEGVTFPVANTAAAGWTCLTPTNGWTAMPFSTRNTCVKDVDGVLRLSGAAQTGGTNMDVLTLPAGLRPAKDAYVTIDLCSGTMGRVHVTPAGIVTVQPETSISNAQCFSSFEGAAFSM